MEFSEEEWHFPKRPATEDIQAVWIKEMEEEEHAKKTEGIPFIDSQRF